MSLRKHGLQYLVFPQYWPEWHDVKMTPPLTLKPAESTYCLWVAPEKIRPAPESLYFCRMWCHKLEISQWPAFNNTYQGHYLMANQVQSNLWRRSFMFSTHVAIATVLTHTPLWPKNSLVGYTDLFLGPIYYHITQPFSRHQENTLQWVFRDQTYLKLLPLAWIL